MDDSSTRDRLPPEAVELLQALLRDDTPAHRALRSQIPHLRVTGGCPCPCPSLDFGPAEVGEVAVEPAPVTGQPVAEAVVLDAAGQEIGGVMVFAHDGYLSNLEVYTWEDAPMAGLPAPDRLRW
ncbi:hypothetical protein [Kitasatospora terrestris]|uniref:GNAT family N-acetyltransferase n=1 Tax=Kitasatospora terrestris TaxID=258051 RepID=A0ABP9EP50_9ACTN